MNIHIIGSGSSGNCTLISDGEAMLLLDVGLPYKDIQSKIGFDLNNYVVFCDHKHLDHSKSIPEFARRGNKIICGSDVAEKFELGNYFNLVPIIELENDCQQIEIKSLIIKPFRIPHLNNDFSECQNYGVVIYSKITGEKLVYMTDFMYCKSKLPQAEYYLIECNYEDDMLTNTDINKTVQVRRCKSHCSLSTLLQILDNTDLSKCKKLYIIHTSDNADKELIKNTIVKRYGLLTIMASE